jgi:peptide/nickel transport system substrate-binding protein
VIDTAFDLATADPGRMFEFTGQIVDRALYSTLLTYTKDNLVLQPQLASGYNVSANGDRYTFTLNPKAVFSDGNQVTAQDVVFSYQRLQNIQGNPSFLLDGIKVSALGTTKVVLSTTAPNAAIPEIVTNPALGVLEASVVKARGGSDATNAVTADKAENWLNTHSAGSGPYEMSEWNLNGPVKLVANPKYLLAKCEEIDPPLVPVGNGQAARCLFALRPSHGRRPGEEGGPLRLTSLVPDKEKK